MNVRVLPRAAVDSYLRLIRVPLDGAIGLLPGNGSGVQPSARLALDRADAALRVVVAAILGDAVLRKDAEQRQAATAEREYAHRLRVEAEHRGAQADSELEALQQEATQRRERANERAEVRVQEADRNQEKENRRAAKAESERMEASGRAAKLAEEALSDRAPKQRLQTLNVKTDALRQKEKELTVRDEARRLRAAASRTKADRKTR